MCAAIATAVVAVAGTAYSVYSAESQKSEAADKAKATEENAANLYGQKVKPTKYKNTVPPYDPQAGAKDYQASMPMLNSIADETNRAATGMREMVGGGKFASNLALQGANIESLLKGTVPKDVQDKVNRIVAEKTGGAFTPGAGNNQQAEADFARSIGKTSYEIMQAGMGYAPQWEQLVDAFTYKPQQAALDALQFLRARTDAQQLQMNIDENDYIARAGGAKAAAQADPQAQGQFHDQIILNQIQQQARDNEMKALLGTVSAVGGAYKSYQTYNAPKTTGLSTTTASPMTDWRTNARGASAYSAY